MGRRNGRAPKAAWTPLQRAYYPDVEEQARLDAQGSTIWQNSSHEIVATPLHVGDMTGPVHLSIKRRDRAAVRDWRIMQRIKNEIMGPEREAYEVYPAESCLVDEANQYHLWVLPEGAHCPFGFDDRHVGSPELAAASGARQRPFDENPPDIDVHGDSARLRLREW